MTKRKKPPTTTAEPSTPPSAPADAGEKGAAAPLYAFDADKLAGLGDQTDPVETRKELLRQLGGMMAAAASRRRKLANHHSYDDPDFTTVLRGFELAGKWLGIANAPGDPKALLQIAAEMKAIVAGRGANDGAPGPKRARGRAKPL